MGIFTLAVLFCANLPVILVQRCPSVPLSGQNVTLEAISSISTISDTQPGQCLRGLVANATKCSNCSASIFINGEYSLGGVLIAETYPYWSKSEINFNGSITVGCCSKATIHGEMLGEDTTRMTIGRKSNIILINLSLIGNGTFTVGNRVDIISGIGYNKITVGHNSSLLIENLNSLKKISAHFENSELNLLSSNFDIKSIFIETMNFSVNHNLL